MNFKQILKRKLYPTWVSTTKYHGCNVYILQMPNVWYFHFQVICDDDQVYYCSLDEGIKFNDFQECCKASEEWIDKNKK